MTQYIKQKKYKTLFLPGILDLKDFTKPSLRNEKSFQMKSTSYSRCHLSYISHCTFDISKTKQEQFPNTIEHLDYAA